MGGVMGNCGRRYLNSLVMIVTKYAIMIALTIITNAVLRSLKIRRIFESTESPISTFIENYRDTATLLQCVYTILD